MESEKWCRNFSNFEKQLLVDMASLRPEIECKAADKTLQKAKQFALAALSDEFVSVSGLKRDALQLKTVSRYFLL